MWECVLVCVCVCMGAYEYECMNVNVYMCKFELCHCVSGVGVKGKYVKDSSLTTCVSRTPKENDYAFTLLESQNTTTIFLRKIVEIFSSNH